MQRATVLYRVWAVCHQLTPTTTQSVCVLRPKRCSQEEGEHWSGSTSGNVSLTVLSQMADALSRIDCMVSTRFQEIGVRRRDARWYRAITSRLGIFSGYLAPLLRYLVLTAQSLTHDNHHPAHYARRRDSAYMQLPGVFLHCDTCARVDGVAPGNS